DPCVASAHVGRGVAVSPASPASRVAIRTRLLVLRKPVWAWPVDVAAYDRDGELTSSEREALAALATRRGRSGHWPDWTRDGLTRLRAPILDVLTLTGAHENVRSAALTVLTREMHARQQTFWAWSAAEWAETLCP